MWVLAKRMKWICAVGIVKEVKGNVGSTGVLEGVKQRIFNKNCAKTQREEV